MGDATPKYYLKEYFFANFFAEKCVFLLNLTHYLYFKCSTLYMHINYVYITFNASAKTLALTVTLYLNCSFCFNKPPSQHGLHVPITEVLVGLQNLTLNHLLQQQATKPPVEEGPHVLPIQNILTKEPRAVLRINKYEAFNMVSI